MKVEGSVCTKGAAALAFALAAGCASNAPADLQTVTAQAADATPTPPWGPGDERGMANTQGPGTWARCAHHLNEPGAKAYELSHIRSNTMPGSPFGAPLTYRFKPTVGLPGAAHAFNGETLEGEPAAQGTQMDALGHFAFLPEAWDGTPPFPADAAEYYGGFRQSEVKPSDDAPLAKLGIDRVPPIVTSGLLLDAKRLRGRALEPGELVTATDIEAMIAAQGLGWRGVLPGDALLIHTGWSENWRDPADDTPYYQMGPGLSYDAVQYVGDKAVVLVSLDNPFTDPVRDGFLRGEAGAPDGTPKALPFAVHHHNLTQSGVLQIQNGKLDDLARDQVWLSCMMVLPLRIEGGSGSPVRPVAIGAPRGG